MKKEFGEMLEYLYWDIVRDCIPECPGDFDVLPGDTKAFAREYCTVPDEKGHMWYTTMRYHDAKQERCVKCGMYREKELRTRRVLDFWGMQERIIKAAQFAFSPEGRKKGSGAIGGLKEAVAEYNKTQERYWVYYNRGTGLAAVMPYDPREVFPLGDVTYQNQAPGPHYDIVGDFATIEEAEADKQRLELPLYE